MFEYAVQKYGADHCSLVSTFMMRKSRSAIRDAARILGIDLAYADKAAKLIPVVYYDDDGEKQTDLSVKESVAVVPELSRMYEEQPELFDTADRISDVPFTTSVHAAGMLISPIPLNDLVPLIPTKKNIQATALPLSDAELAGVVKMDFLSLASLSVYENTQKDLGIHLDFDEMDYDIPEVWDLIGSKYITGLFQISSKTYKARMHRLKPRSIQELAHCLALLRGPCISSGADQEYMEILEGKRQPDFIHTSYYKVTKSTQGILIYQEQIMALAVEFGFTLEQGYSLMKAVSKKKPEAIKAWKEQFVTNALAKDVTSEQAERMWKMIEISGAYAFNQAHAVSYAILCYVSAYLKHYYPKEFLKNLLTNAFERSKEEEIEEAVADCLRLGYRFLPPDVNHSHWDFRIEDDKLRIGFCALKGFGRIASEEMITKRPFHSFEDVMARLEKSKCGKRAMIPAIFSNVFSEYGTTEAIYEQFCTLRKEEPLKEIRLQSKEVFKTSAPLQDLEPLFLTTAFTTVKGLDIPSCGFHELRNKQEFSTEAILINVKRHKTKTGARMAFLTLATGDGQIEGIVFPQSFTVYEKVIKKNKKVSIKARKDGQHGCIIQHIS